MQNMSKLHHALLQSIVGLGQEHVLDASTRQTKEAQEAQEARDLRPTVKAGALLVDCGG